MAMAKSLVVVLALFLLSVLASSTTVSHDGRALLINGQRRIIISGSIHYPRSTPEMWPELIKKAKEGGLDAIETYVFWNVHEPVKRQYNFEGNLDLVRFIKEVQNAGLYAIVRIGPYVCAEWDYGGFPAWLRQIPGMEMRTDNKPFKDEMQTFTTLIVDMLKKENLMAPQGGPIILAQIENEYGNIQSGYGAAANKYIQWCANMAQSLGIGVPWIMCQQADAPQPMINTCNGFYCHDFQPNNANSPKIWTENWTGWFKDWDKPDPHRPAEDVAYAVARFFETNGTVQNYYMYHGGTNFGRTSGGPYITTTYDYDAPLDEYGNIRQPKWGHLKELHAVLKSMEKALVYGNYNSKQLENGVQITEYTGKGITPGCFISNSNTTLDATVEYHGHNYFVPASSVSILPECKEEVYNTAKVNTQTSVMVKRRSQVENEPEGLSWSWRPEAMTSTLKGALGSFRDHKLLDQILATDDKSDYLWYMNTFDHPMDMDMTLQVATQGHVLHAFVNGDHVGSQYAADGNFSFTFEAGVKIKMGKNYISLLSGTIGHSNYGARYELVPTGIAGGPVFIIGGGMKHDLSSELWAYKVGLDGEDNEIYMDSPSHKWHTDSIPTMRPFTWYKTTFKAPLGDEAVVVNLEGMGKGVAWVNGNNLGRYWPTTIANNQGCQQCDYRQPYSPDNQCRSGCGEPGQIWYHIPRSFLKETEPNTLILFEEAGGEPFNVNFQTVTVGTVCGHVEEGKTLTLSCQGTGIISNIEFASFGNPDGMCGAFQKGTCDSQIALDAIQKACVGKMACSIEGSASVLGDSKCKNMPVSLAVQAVCS
ncbi:Beta-galactosidase protein [Dioscorea alata]|uniref:Beta-galactosidase protein n=1 Tax=Dioscorea alata TaxID=55571 RepID=A0ACB7UUI9_DIOAL|nr:Beta-galactosidase protein [Dioscorea alata]